MTAPPLVFTPGFCIFDRIKQKPYIWRSWPTRREATWELRDLLAPYSAESEWRVRLVIAEYTGKPVPVGAKQGMRVPRASFVLS